MWEKVGAVKASIIFFIFSMLRKGMTRKRLAHVVIQHIEIRDQGHGLLIIHSDSILTTLGMFSLRSVTFSKFLRVYYFFSSLATTALCLLIHCDTHSQSVQCCFLFSGLVGAWLLVWICLADLLYLQDSVDHYDYLFEFFYAPRRSRYLFCGGFSG